MVHATARPWSGREVIPDRPADGAIEGLSDMAKEYEVVIFTTRAETGPGRAAVIAWLEAHEFDASLVTVTNEKSSEGSSAGDGRVAGSNPLFPPAAAQCFIF